MILSFSGSVLALDFDSDTKYSKDNINFVFKEGLSINEFDIVNGGIIIDALKYGFILQGGEITVNFYSVDEIGVSSNVPQKISFVILDDGIKQYLKYDGTIFIDDINVDLSEKNFKIVPSEVKDIDVVDYFKDATPIERKNWAEKKVFEIEYDTQTSNTGVIVGKTLSITNLGLLSLVLIILLGFVLWLVFKQ